jgi:uncharacterized protein (DUF983 family)
MGAIEDWVGGAPAMASIRCRKRHSVAASNNFPEASPYSGYETISIQSVMTSKKESILRGLMLRCPRCGEGHLFRAYLKPVDSCTACGEPLGHIRADDFPPYLTILVVGHIVMPLVLIFARAGLSTEAQIALWIPVTLGLTLLLLPRLKGAVIGLMWSMGMTGNEAG